MPKKKVARRQFIKQGSMATVLATARLTRAEPSSEREREPKAASAQYQGPLDGADLKDRQFDSQAFSLASYGHIKPSMTFSSGNEASARAWQKQVRAKLVELVGGFPPSRVALRPDILERKGFSGYVREKVVIQTRDELSAFGYFLIPRDRPSPIPAVICLPGHGRGCDDIVGITEEGKQRDTKSGYAKDFALQVVENGYAALALEQLAFGCRRDDAARKKGQGQSSCQPAAGAALLFGETMIGWRVWDVMRAIDYLSTRPEIDPQRIATMGVSGGGTVSFFSGALDQRIKISVVSAYFNTFRDSIVSRSHCMDNYVPGILNYVEMYDIAGLVAPRRLFVESGTRDRIFPIEASREAFKKAQHIYTIFGVPERIEREIFEGEHEFHGKGAFEFLKKWL